MSTIKLLKYLPKCHQTPSIASKTKLTKKNYNPEASRRLMEKWRRSRKKDIEWWHEKKLLKISIEFFSFPSFLSLYSSICSPPSSLPYLSGEILLRNQTERKERMIKYFDGTAEEQYYRCFVKNSLHEHV